MTEGTQFAAGSYVFVAASTLLLGVGVAWTRRLGGMAQQGARFLIALLALRLVLIGNPLAWEVYVHLLSPEDVGWRQYDAILVKRAEFLRADGGVPYLAVGSSQTAAIYGALAHERHDLATFSVAALQPIDLLLYRRQIERSRPVRILLYLSEFDISRRPSPDAVVIAPAQALGAFDVMERLWELPDRAAYRGAAAAMLMGEIFPEYKYRFVFRALGDKVLLRLARAAGAAQPPVRDRATDEQLLAWARASMAPAYIPFNLSLIAEFLGQAAEHGTEVIIVEGQYNPKVLTPALEVQRQSVRASLQALTAGHPLARYLPRERVREFVEADYTDLSHVNPTAGYDFATRVLQLLESERLDTRNAAGVRSAVE